MQNRSLPSRLVQLPRLYFQFVRYQPSLVGRIIALIPAFVLLVAMVLLSVAIDARLVPETLTDWVLLAGCVWASVWLGVKMSTW